MTSDRPTSDDPQQEAEAFAQGDEAFDESSNLGANFLEAVEQDPSLDPSNQVDLQELAELGSLLDDPEAKVTLSDGSDDPDGLSEPPASAIAESDDQGSWDLDEPHE